MTAGEHVRAGIVRAATELLASEGIDVSMAAVAEVAGVGRATLYRYFPSRESLVHAVCLAGIAEATERLEGAHLDSVPPGEALARMARAILAVGTRYIVMVREPRLPEHEPAQELVLGRIHSILDRARSEGLVRDDVSVEWQVASYATLLLAGIEHAWRHGLGIEEAAAAVVDQFLLGAGRG
ncbi:MAG: helix-turn-helix transcriptional regulator [Thermoleophilia bacterium]|nr:helix-turn-helix transcriptional regulator [Thermoleophilia bacterium]